MMNMRPFQIVLMGIFVLLAIGGFIFITLFRTTQEGEIKGYGDSVMIWGTLEARAMREVLEKIENVDKDFQVVAYEEKDPDSFDGELLNAIAEDRPPDLVVIQHDVLVKHRAKLYPISYETITERSFRDTYVDGAEIFMRPDGIYGIPFAVDPLVMYWNRDIFSTSGVAEPPRTWEEFVSVTTPAVTKKDSRLNISQSSVAFGEYNNVTHAKKVLSMLFLQAGTDIIEESNDQYVVTLGDNPGGGLPPAQAALDFYTQFASPANQNYSWSRSLSRDTLQFLAGELGLYFAPGSEYANIKAQNPNLNFDVTRVPQGAGTTVERNYGTFYAFAIPKTADNIQGAYKAAQVIASPEYSDMLVTALLLAPVHRSLISRGTGDRVREVLYESALISRGWLDPDPEETERIYEIMIEDVTSGRSRVGAAIGDAIGRLRLAFE